MNSNRRKRYRRCEEVRNKENEEEDSENKWRRT